MTVSIIICSRNSSISSYLHKNIQETIFRKGSPYTYEIIIIDNHTNKYSIFEAYNSGLERSSGELLCFMHDDIEFLTKEWGDHLLEIFKNPQIGACAIAGCQILRNTPSFFNIPEYSTFNIIHQNTHIQTHNQIVPIVTFDGVWFCIHRKCFKKIKFDEHTYKGFHFYDMDTAVQLHQAGYKILFTPKILIKHSGTQTNDKCWLENSYNFYNKWKYHLPLFSTTPKPPEEFMQKTEMDGIYTSLRLIIRYKCFYLIPSWYKMAGVVLRQAPLPACIKTLFHHVSQKSHK